jgi:GNAT superfamily N-acetyltransferase
MSKVEGVSIGAFRGDYEALERMAHASWREEYGDASFPNFYRPAFLRFLFDRIPADRKDHLLLAAYKDGQIVAFLANLPQTFHFKGGSYRAVYSCLLVTGREYLRRGVALALVRHAIETNKNYNYDFSLLTLETGHRSTLMMEKLRGQGNRIERIRKSGVRARILDLRRVADSEGLKGYEKAAIVLVGSHLPPKPAPGFTLREYGPADLDACHALLDRYKETVELALTWDKRELAVELDCPDVSRTLVWEKDGRVQAMINYILHDHLGKTVERWAWINHIAFPDLSRAERAHFIQAYLGAIKAAGCIGTLDWTRRGWPGGPFWRARFFPYPRAVNLVSWTFNPEISLAGIPVVYEIQV